MANQLDGHVPALDGIRGIAILSVLVLHVPLFEPRGQIERLVTMLAAFGWAGVDLFFVLSGFLISGILLNARGSDTYYRAFYMRRTLRIFPLYYAYCAVLFLVLPFWYGWGSPDARMLAAAAPWYLTYLLNVRVALGNGWIPATVAGTAFFWSLGVEEQFYLLWPATVARVSRERLTALCVGLIVLALLFRVAMVSTGHLIAAYVLLPGRMDGLALGSWLAITMREPEGARRLGRRAPIVLVGAGAALIGIVATVHYAGWDDPWMATIGLTCTATASAALIVMATRDDVSRTSRALSARWLRFFGRHAYGMYVLGGVAAMLVATSGLADAVPPRAAGSALPAWTWHLALTLGTTTALALVSFEVLEQPALALKRYFPYRKRAVAESDETSLAGVHSTAPNRPDSPPTTRSA